jgi:hypothetical protein
LTVATLAADLLIDRLCRPVVEAALARAGVAEPALDQPFLITRELFILKLEQWPSLASRYVRADTAGRRALLADVDRMPLPTMSSAAGWAAPRAIDSVEWFPSAEAGEPPGTCAARSGAGARHRRSKNHGPFRSCCRRSKAR